MSWRGDPNEWMQFWHCRWPRNTTAIFSVIISYEMTIIGYVLTQLTHPFLSCDAVHKRGLCLARWLAGWLAFRLLTYLVDEHSALLASIAWSRPYLISNFPPSAAELFRLPPHRSGTYYQKQSFRHQHCGGSSTDWKLSYFNYPSFSSTVVVVSQ